MVKGDVSTDTGPGPYTEGVDHGGNDMPPCRFAGCAMPPNSTHMDCERKCKGTAGCAGYVFADPSCAGGGGGGGEGRCWTKASMGKPSRYYCLPCSLNYCLPISTTVCLLSQPLSALNYCLSSTVCLSQLTLRPSDPPAPRAAAPARFRRTLDTGQSKAATRRRVG